MQKNRFVLLGSTLFGALIVLGIYVYMDSITQGDLNTAIAVQAVPAPGQSEHVKPPFPQVSTGRNESHGAEAIAALGDKLPEVAHYYGWTEDQLKQRFTKDASFTLDAKGHIFVKDGDIISVAKGKPKSGSPQAISATGGSDLSPSGGLAPLDQTFFLHSRPGSSKTIYLDFDGRVLQGGQSAWADTYNGGQTLNAPAFDTDGDPTTFSDSERTVIQQIWQRVAEDYSPYNVDVTTQDPGADKITRSSTSDTVYGNVILFSQMSQFGNAGGISYIGDFDDVGDYYKVALVFPQNMAYSGRYMGLGASHEEGHGLGLSHQGNQTSQYYYGQGNWAPIMGVGYYVPIVQWSKGEYSGANNTEDEETVMTQNGLQFVNDDYGNTISSASPLTISGNNASAAGFIEKPTDVDFFSFNTGAGTISFSVNVASNGPDLDSKVTLYDGSGKVIASGDDPNGLSSSVSATVPGGTYYVSVEGVGSGDPLVTGYTDYGSLGQYYLSGTIVGVGNSAPSVVISANPTSGGSPLTVQFSSAGTVDPSGLPMTYSWNFGDGTTDTSANPTKVYTSSGTYTATLTVSDSNSLSASKSIIITVANLAPTASESVTPASGNVPLTITVNGGASSDPDGGIASYVWNFGDGTTGTGVTATHTYSSPGTFPVTLTVTDVGGLSATSKAVSVVTTDPNAINAPSNLTASSNPKNPGKVTLSWIDNSSNETGFVIERAVQVKTGVPIYSSVGNVATNVKTFTDSVSAGAYYYRVRAFSSTLSKYSVYSNVASARVK